MDSIEGVTHALRTNEYHDRNDQYYWVVDALKLRKPLIWDFSRLNFVYTLLSKRKLQWFVDKKLVRGWDDPRFPTVRGIRRRGLTIEALREFIMEQGASKNVMLLEWDKLWSINKKVIDPVAPRYTALSKEGVCAVELIGGPAEAYAQETPLHRKDESIGKKTVWFSSKILLEQEDAAALEDNEEVTLMNWGNAIVRSIRRDATGCVLSVQMQLHLEGDFKKTKKKLTWLAQRPDLVTLELVEFDFLITKKKLEEEDDFEQFVNPQTEFRTATCGEPALVALQKGAIIQLERRGFYVVDTVGDASHPFVLLSIPDGRAKAMSTLSTKVAPTCCAVRDGAKPTPPVANSMYAMRPIVDYQEHIDVSGSPCYQVKPVIVDASSSKTASSVNCTADKLGAMSLTHASTAAAEAVRDEVQRLDLRVGYVAKVERHPDADTLYVEQIDVGEEKPRTVISGLVKFLAADELQGKHVALVCNLKPANMRGIKSEAMVLCAGNADKSKVELLRVPEGSRPGDRIYVDGFDPIPDEQLNPKKKIWETVQPELKTDSSFVATYRGHKLMTSRGVLRGATLAGASIS